MDECDGEEEPQIEFFPQGDQVLDFMRSSSKNSEPVALVSGEDS